MRCDIGLTIRHLMWILRSALFLENKYDGSGQWLAQDTYGINDLMKLTVPQDVWIRGASLPKIYVCF